MQKKKKFERGPWACIRDRIKMANVFNTQGHAFLCTVTYSQPNLNFTEDFETSLQNRE